jgi:glycosyltransferase involved in cell wall biosynthesis
LSDASVIIAAHNAEKYIEKTIDSVLSQSYANIECIVVDDGSTDYTRQILSKYGDSIKYIYQDNAERSVARNTGTAHAIGKYINYVDADDLITPDKIADQVKYLEENSGIDVVYSKVKYFKDDGGRSYYVVPRITPQGDILDKLIYGNFINLGSPLIRKEAVDRVGGFDANRLDIILNEDWDLWVRLAISGSRFGFIDKYHYYYRVHASNTSNNRIRGIESKLRVAEKNIQQYGQELEERGIDCQRVLMFVKAEYGRRLILEGRVAEGRGLIAEACKTDIPHRRYLQMFSLAARLFGHHILAATQHRRKKEL